MDAKSQTHTRNSRWSRDPVVDRDGAAVGVYPTERDIEIFKLQKTPYERIVESPYIASEVNESLELSARALNPFQLKKTIERKLKTIFNLVFTVTSFVRHRI